MNSQHFPVRLVLLLNQDPPRRQEARSKSVAEHGVQNQQGQCYIGKILEELPTSTELREKWSRANGFYV